MQIRMVERNVVVLSPCWLHCLVWLCAWLCQAGIQLWVLTGDKLETARNIGFSTKLLSDAMDWEGTWHEWQNHDMSEDWINIWRIHHRYPWVYRSDIIFFNQPWMLDVLAAWCRVWQLWQKSVFQCEATKCSQIWYSDIMSICNLYMYISKWSMDVPTHTNSQFVFRTPMDLGIKRLEVCALRTAAITLCTCRTLVCWLAKISNSPWRTGSNA